MDLTFFNYLDWIQVRSYSLSIIKFAAYLSMPCISILFKLVGLEQFLMALFLFYVP